MNDGPASKTERPARIRRCAICTVDAPSVRTLGTLAQHGWRLRVVALADGATRTEYCCAACCETLTGSAPLKTR